jgi:hypothetical protein
LLAVGNRYKGVVKLLLITEKADVDLKGIKG